MPEPTDSGTRMEYAIRYDAPAEYAGLVTNVRAVRSIAAGMARQEMAHPGGLLRCTVVQREVTFGEWQDSPEETITDA